MSEVPLVLCATLARVGREGEVEGDWWTRIEEQLLLRNVKRFRGGLVFKAHRLLYHSTLGSRVIQKKVAGGRALKKRNTLRSASQPRELGGSALHGYLETATP